MMFNINISPHRSGGNLQEYNNPLLLCASPMSDMMGKINVQINFEDKTESRFLQSLRHWLQSGAEAQTKIEWS